MKKALHGFCLLLLIFVSLTSFADTEQILLTPYGFVNIFYVIPAHFSSTDYIVDDQSARFHADLTGSGIEIAFSADPLARRITNGQKTSRALMQKMVESALSGEGIVPLREPLVFQINRRLAARFKYGIETAQGLIPEESMVLLHDGHVYMITCRAQAGQEEALEAFADQFFETVWPLMQNENAGE